jgi:predicted PurR-regulated permease PerM
MASAVLWGLDGRAASGKDGWAPWCLEAKPRTREQMIRVLDPRALRAALTILSVAAALALIYLLRTVLLLLVFSVVFAYVIFPFVKLVERSLPGPRRRSVAIAAVYLVLVAAVSTIAAFVGPRLGRELAALGEKAPAMSAQIQSGRIIGHIFPSWRGADVLDGLIRSHLPEVVGYAQYALSAALAWLSGAWVVVLMPIFAFFLLRDAERIADAVTGLIDDDQWRQLSVTIALDLHRLLGQYIGALLLLCTLTFAVWSAVFLVAGVPYALTLAAIGGTLEFLPMLGPLVAGVIVIGVTLFSGFPHPWLLVLFVLAWRLAQDYLTSPLIMGRGVELDPGLVIFGVLAGGELAGPVGMFLSVPMLAGLRIVWRRLRAFRSEPRS